MMILQNLMLPKSSGVIHAELYFRGPECHVFTDGSLIIPSDHSAVFNTSINYFCPDKWKRYTGASDFVFEVELDGSALVEMHCVRVIANNCYQKFIGSVFFKTRDKAQRIAIPELEDNSLVFVRIIASGGPARILSGRFCSLTCPTVNDISVAVCICTFNRHSFLIKLIEQVSYFIKIHGFKAHLIIANNGDDLDFPVPDCVTLLKNRNLGGAGGFTRAISFALEKGSTHVVLMDDDIEVEIETLFRTMQLLRLCSPSYADSFVSGSMLSGDEPWIQYERNTVLEDGRFQHQGHFLDLRDPFISALNSLALEIRGVAGWWYCAIPALCFRERGLPLPLFIRGDDVEFSLRCEREIISMNGINVWHEPFWRKFSEIMENYYLPRNMTIISYCAFLERPSMRKVFLWDRFWRNIFTYNYIGATLNVLALEHILVGKYEDDPADLHMEMMQITKQMHSLWIHQRSCGVLWRWKRSFTKAGYWHVLSLLVLLVLPFVGTSGIAMAGFDRLPEDFAWRRKVLVYDKVNNLSFNVTLNRRLVLRLIRDFSRLWLKAIFQKLILRRRLQKFSFDASSHKAWAELFERF